MKITLVSLDNWGLNKHIAIALEKKGHTVHHIDFNTFVYKYPNPFYKLYNFILKLFFKTNLKNIYYGNEIIKRLINIDEKQDIILTIKGDFIEPKKILEFKKFTDKSIAYFNDSSSRCPKIERVIPCFDEVYSFEKKDCKKYNLKFIPNWIYTKKNNNQKSFEYEVFNISSKDKRFPTISKIASALKERKIKYKIIVLDKKNKNTNPDIEYISKHLSLAEVENYTNNSKILLDIHRTGQEGLTFRVFESLGLQKKLITTNNDIVNYDFYDPINILIIDENNPLFREDFFNNDYKQIPDAILKKYTLDGWIETILN
jgi:hypothetical protein